MGFLHVAIFLDFLPNDLYSPTRSYFRRADTLSDTASEAPPMPNKMIRSREEDNPSTPLSAVRENKKRMGKGSTAGRRETQWNLALVQRRPKWRDNAHPNGIRYSDGIP